MSQSAIELYVRRASDVATLRRVEQALIRLGLTAELVAAPGARGLEALGLPEGGAACALRVVVDAGEPLTVGIPQDGMPWILLWDSCVPLEYLSGPASSGPGPQSVATLLGGSQGPWDGLQWVGVPGEALARSLGLRIPVETTAAGLPRLDFVRDSLASARREAREALGLPEDSPVVVYAPSANASDSATIALGERVLDLCRPERTVVILAEGWPTGWLESHRRWAASRSGLLLAETDDASPWIASADLVVGDVRGRLWEARGLGIRTLCIGPESGALPFDGCVSAAEGLAGAVTSILERGADASACDLDALRADGGAAARVAARIQETLGTPRAESAELPPRPSELFARLEARSAFGEGEEAGRELRRYLSTYPSAEGYALLASIERRGGHLEAAVAAAERAVELGREGAARALCERARIDVERGEFPRARDQFEQAEKLCPTLPDVWIGQATLDLNSNDPATAEARYRTALELEKSGRAWSGLGLALAAQGRFRDALGPFEAALDLDPDSQAALYGLVHAGFMTGELALAAERVERFVENHPGSLGFAFTLAGLRHELGDLAAAHHWIERIEMFDPAYPGLVELRQKLSS